MQHIERPAAKRSLLQRAAVTAVGTAASIATLLLATPSAQAATSGEVHTAGPYKSESVCLDEQHTYVRYYRIVDSCNRPNGHLWVFTYTARTL